jgi:hypothetical protein
MDLGVAKIFETDKGDFKGHYNHEENSSTDSRFLIKTICYRCLKVVRVDNLIVEQHRRNEI